jgi:F-type H+-transporting ATPase subunit alpha
MPVEKQIAIIFCGTRNLLKNIPAVNVANFEVEFLHHMEVSHKEVLKNLQEGKLLDEDVKVLEQAAAEISKKYETKK